MNENVFIVFASEVYEYSLGAYDSLGVFDTLKAAQVFYESAMVETDWEYSSFDTLEEVEAYHQSVGAGQCRKRPCGDYQHKVSSERRTSLQIFGECMHIATIKDDKLVICSELKDNKWTSV